MKLIFSMHINMKACFKLVLWSWWKRSIILRIPKIASLNVFIISKKVVRDEVDFLHADKHQNFYKLELLLLMEVARHVQSTQNSKLVKFLQYIRKKSIAIAFVFYCDRKHSDTLRGSSHVHCYFFWVVLVRNGCGLLGKICYISRIIWWNKLTFCMLIQI